MMMIMDKKKTLNQILGADPREKKEEGAEESALSIIAKELIEAVHSKDANAVANALSAAISECWGASEEG